MDCSISVDGTDFTITEPTPFSPIWFSHKTNGPAIRYEVALSVRSANLKRPTNLLCVIADTPMGAVFNRQVKQI